MEFSIGDEVTINKIFLNYGYEFDPYEPFTIVDMVDKKCLINAEYRKKIGSNKRIIVRNDGLKTLFRSILH